MKTDPIPVPPGLTIVDNSRHRLIVSLRWFQPDSFAMIAIGLVGVANITIILRDNEAGMINMTFLTIFTTPFLWYGLAYIFNKSIITADHATLKVKHRPIWWIPTNVPLKSITSLSVVQDRDPIRGKPCYHILAHKADNKSRDILTAIHSQQAAEHIRDLLDNHLVTQQQAHT